MLTGLGFTVMAVLGVTIGNTDNNVIDFVVFGILHGFCPPSGICAGRGGDLFVVYYGIFLRHYPL